MSSTRNSYFTRNWLTQFNLYRYHSADSEKSLKQRNRDKFVIFCGLAMISGILCIIAAIAVLAISSPLLENEVIPVEKLNTTKSINPNFSMNQTSTEHPPNSRPLKPPVVHAIDEHRKLVTDKIPLNHLINETEYLLEREDVQPRYLQRKVKFFINPMYRYRNAGNVITVPTIRNQIPRPPNYRNLVAQRRQYDYEEDEEEEPRPFNFVHDGVVPSEFQKGNCTGEIQLKEMHPINNIQDILRQSDVVPLAVNGKHKSTSGMKIAGSYRHPTGKDIPAILSKITRRQHHQVQGPKLNEQYYTDPLNSYKPRSPGEINMLAMNQFKFMRPNTKLKTLHQPNHYQPQYSNNVENIYQNVITAGKDRQKQLRTSRTSISNRKHKPFSLMLDIYPMPENEQSPGQRPYKTKLRKPYFPLPAGPGAVNNLPYSYQLGNSYYNSMQFPQIQQNKHPQTSNFYENTYLHNQLHDNEDIYQREYSARYPTDGQDNNPSKIMVHLNLFPKNKARSLDRSSNTRSLLSPGYNFKNSLTSKIDKTEISTPAPIVALSTKTGNKIRFEQPIVVSAEVELPSESNPFRNYSNNGIAPIAPSGSTDFQVPQESILKFQYNDAVTMVTDRNYRN